MAGRDTGIVGKAAIAFRAQKPGRCQHVTIGFPQAGFNQDPLSNARRVYLLGDEEGALVWHSVS